MEDVVSSVMDVSTKLRARSILCLFFSVWLFSVIVCRTMLCHAVPCRAVHAVPCHAVPCRAVLCCAVLCYAVSQTNKQTNKHTNTREYNPVWLRKVVGMVPQRTVFWARKTVRENLLYGVDHPGSGVYCLLLLIAIITTILTTTITTTATTVSLI